jgi:hypothetical protein
VFPVQKITRFDHGLLWEANSEEERLSLASLFNFADWLTLSRDFPVF